MNSFSIDAANRRASVDPRDPAFFNDPYPTYRAIREVAPVFYWEQYGFWCFAAHADVAALLRDRRFGRQVLHVATREELGWAEPGAHLAPFLAVERHSLLELEPPEHARLRTLVNRAFVSRQVERLAPDIAALTHDLIDRFASSGSVDLLQALATQIPVVVIARLLGAPTTMWRELLDWSHRMVAMYQFGVTRRTEEDAAAAAADFSAFLRSYVEDRRRRRSDDLISRLIDAEEAGGRLSEDELVATCILLLNAGHEATVHGLGNGVKAMLETSLDAAAAFADESASASLVEELLRYDAPLHLFTRYALEDLVYQDVAFKKGDRIGLLLGAANRDPLRFADPDRLDPRRSPNPHVAFGGGIHFCVGAPLARLELATVLPILFQRLPELSLAAPPRYRDSFHFRGLESLPVRWRA
jgi:cytochrome P450